MTSSHINCDRRSIRVFSFFFFEIHSYIISTCIYIQLIVVVCIRFYLSISRCVFTRGRRCKNRLISTSTSTRAYVTEYLYNFGENSSSHERTAFVWLLVLTKSMLFLLGCIHCSLLSEPVCPQFVHASVCALLLARLLLSLKHSFYFIIPFFLKKKGVSTYFHYPASLLS